MNTLIDWYPGDSFAIVCVEALGMMTALLVVTWAADQWLARRRAALRCGLWQAALVGVLLTPLFVLAGRQLPWRLAILAPVDGGAVQMPERSEPATADMHFVLADSPAPTLKAHKPQIQDVAVADVSNPDAKNIGAVIEGQEIANKEIDAAPRATTNAPIDAGAAAPLHSPDVVRALTTMALIIWGIGSLFICLRLAVGWCRLRTLRHQMRPLQIETWTESLTAVAGLLSLRRIPNINTCPVVHSPLVVGVFSPSVVIPEKLLENSSPEQIREILIHECAHIARRDLSMRVLQYLSFILFWVHPLVHVLNRRLDQAREEICDNHVLAHADAPSYAETLLTVSQFCHSVAPVKGYLTMLPRHQNLERRVADLLEERRDIATRLGRGHRLVLATALIAVLAACGSVGLQSAASAGDGSSLFAVLQGQQGLAKDGEQTREPATGKIVGHVVNADGSPVAGAVVWASEVNTYPLKRRESISDARGQYVLEVPAGNWYVWARLGSKGGEPQDLLRGVVVSDVSTSKANIVLEERGTLRGRLTDAETGKPIAAGKLYLEAGYVVSTGPDGKFETGGLSRISQESFVVAPGYRRIRVLFDTTGHANTELEIGLERATKIVGRVTDQDGKPIAGAYVNRGAGGKHFALTGLYQPCDADGRFVYEGAAPEQAMDLYANAPGYFYEKWSGVASKLDGKPVEVQFRLRPNPATNPNAKPADKVNWRAVSGTVLDPAGKPASAVVVRWGLEHLTTSIQARTDDQGRFRMTVPDEAKALAVLPREFTPEFPSIEVGGDKTVQIKLRDGKTITGRVQDGQGKPIQGVRVSATVGVAGFRDAGGVGLESRATTDDQGNFALKGMPERAQLYFFKENLNAVRAQLLKYDVAGNPEPVIMHHIGAIYGKAEDQDGKPLRNFRVQVTFPRERKPTDKGAGGHPATFGGTGISFTSADGTFVLSGVGAGGVYRVTVLANGHGDAVADRVTAISANRVAESKPEVLKVGALRSLRVQTLTTDSKPIKDARVTLINGDLRLDKYVLWGSDDVNPVNSVRGRTADDGWADFSTLNFAEATVLLQAPGYARKHIPWRNGEDVLRNKLAPEAVLSGEICDAKGVPIDKCAVRLTTGGDSPTLLTPTGNDKFTVSITPDDKGRFRIAELPAGEWTVSILKGGAEPLYQEDVVLKAGETKELKIKLNK